MFLAPLAISTMIVCLTSCDDLLEMIWITDSTKVDHGVLVDSFLHPPEKRTFYRKSDSRWVGFAEQLWRVGFADVAEIDLIAP